MADEPSARPRRSSAFFRSDVSSEAETAAYKLGDDYGLTEDQTADLAIAIEAAIHNAWPDR